MFGHLRKSELGEHDLPHFSEAFLALDVALSGGISEHRHDPFYGRAERVLRRLGGLSVQGYGQETDPGNKPAERAKTNHENFPLVENRVIHPRALSGRLAQTLG